MDNERRGRSEARVYYLETDLAGVLREADNLKMVDLLKKMILCELEGLVERVYDPEAVAFGDETDAPGEEPVLLHDWRGRFFEDPKGFVSDGCLTYDFRGLRVVLRGKGLIQGKVQKVMEEVGIEPDEGRFANPTYTVGSRVGRVLTIDSQAEGWGKPIPPKGGYVM